MIGSKMSGMKMNQTPQKSSKILELIQKIRDAKDPLDIMLNYDYLLDEIEGQYNDSRFGGSIKMSGFLNYFF